MLTSRCASRHNGVQFFISHLARWLRTRRFSEPTFRPSGATNHWKNAVFRDFPTFSCTCIFFLLTLSLLSSSLFFSSLFYSSLLSDPFHLCFSSVHIVGSLTSKLPSIIYIYQPIYSFNPLYICVSFSNQVVRSTRPEPGQVILAVLSGFFWEAYPPSSRTALQGMPLSETNSCSAGGQMQKALQARSCETFMDSLDSCKRTESKRKPSKFSSLSSLIFFLAIKNEGAAFWALDVHPAVLALWEVSRRRNASTPVQGLADF